jgi:hypothetical protein
MRFLNVMNFLPLQFLLLLQSYTLNKERLETMHHWPKEDSEEEAMETMDDDAAYPLPYSA